MKNRINLPFNVFIISCFLVFLASCSINEEVKTTKIGSDTKDTGPYSLYTPFSEMTKEGRVKHPYLLSSEPSESVYKYGRYALPSYNEDFDRKQLGEETDKDGYTELEKKRLEPYSVRTNYVPNIHDYLKIFKQYKKPKIRAFLLGNKDYKTDSLRYSVNDVYLFKAFLQKVLSVSEDNISISTDLQKGQFIERFRAFSKEVKRDELVVIFYSGHSEIDGTPIFTDMQGISSEIFYSLLNNFDNDTVLIMDASYLLEQNDDSYLLGSNVRNVVETGSMRSNIFRLYSNLLEKDNKEGNYRFHFILRQYFKKTYAMLEQMDIYQNGNGLFTLLLMSFFADFSYFSPPYIEASYETIYSYINNVISLMEESYGVAEGFVVTRPKRYPIIDVLFSNPDNNYVLFKDSFLKEKSYNENAILRAMYKKAIQLQNQKQYDLAANLFMNIFASGGDYRGTKKLLSRCYLSLAELETNKSSDKVIELYKNSLKYDSSSALALYGLGDAYSRRGDDKNAKVLFVQAQDELKNNPDKAIEGRVNQSLEKISKKDEGPYALLRKGYNAYSDGNLDKAMDFFFRAESGFRELNNDLYVATCLNNIGSVYLTKKDYASALSFYRASLEIKEKIKDYEGIANSYNNLGIVYNEQKEYKIAIDYLSRALVIFDRLKLSDTMVAQSHISLSSVYLSLSRYEEAYLEQKKAVFILSGIKSPFLLKEQIKLENIRNKVF